MTRYPPVMKNAREDLGANVFGRFSPADWDAILAEANRRLDGYLAFDPPVAPEIAWRRVMIEFTKENHWGFRPDHRPERRRRTWRPSLGVRLIWTTFVTFTVSLIALAWSGQTWTRTGEARHKYLFLLVLTLVVANLGHFLWSTRHHRD